MARTLRSVASFTLSMDQAMMVVLGGELDLANADELRAVLADAAADGELHVDLAEVEFLDCAALGVIVEVANRVRSAGHRVTLHRPPGLVRRMIEIARLEELVEVVPA